MSATRPCNIVKLYIFTDVHTHTFAQNIIANSDVECISRAKTLQLHLTGMGR